ncbi:MAG: TatD family hydrolase [Proteiniphilum sp.]|jgi:TatD DNase family protein|nr:TatD family hydrolase [Proteiniphilum sp.]
MNIIDTHAHLFAEDFQDDLNEVVLHARQAGVVKALLPNIDETTIDDLKAAVSHDPGFFLPMMGLHPTSVTKEWEKQLLSIGQEIRMHNYIAVGEIGIDLYWDRSLLNEQIYAFEEQLRWSIEMDLPVAIHFRNATGEVVTSIKRVGEKALRGVFHSFGGSREELNEILQLENFRLGINGIVTYRNAGLAETLIHCPKERVVLETDSPWLAPVPKRGKRNEPAYLTYILNKLADIWGVSEEEVAMQTSRNAIELFNINQ